MADNDNASSVDADGRLALQLCESLLNVLVEEGVIPKEKALEVLETVSEVISKTAESDENTRNTARAAAMALVTSLTGSVADKAP